MPKKKPLKTAYRNPTKCQSRTQHVFINGIKYKHIYPVKSGLIGKDSDAGRDWGQEEKGMTENEMAGWHH